MGESGAAGLRINYFAWREMVAKAHAARRMSIEFQRRKVVLTFTFRVQHRLSSMESSICTYERQSADG
jgi:hypothetical protein